MNTDLAINNVSNRHLHDVYSWEGGCNCASLVREYIQERTGIQVPPHFTEQISESDAFRVIVKTGGMLKMYSDNLDKIECLERVGDVQIGDIVVVGSPNAPILLSSKGTVYKFGRKKVLMGIVEPGGRLLHWTDKGLATAVSSWMPWIQAAWRIKQ